MLDNAAHSQTGRSWGLAGTNLASALDPRAIVESRVGTGGAAPSAVQSMITHCEQTATALHGAVIERRQRLDQAEQRLLEQARRTAAGTDPL
jgi:argininosuccinate lyase